MLCAHCLLQPVYAVRRAQGSKYVSESDIGSAHLFICYLLRGSHLKKHRLFVFVFTAPVQWYY